MKKLLLFLCLFGISLAGFSQTKTAQRTYYKVKIGHNLAFRLALENHVAKYRKLNTEYAISVSYITGGKHNNEYVIFARRGLSWTQRDAINPLTIEMQKDFSLNVAPHVEAVTGGGIITYSEKYSNTPYELRTAKSRVQTFTLKPFSTTEFWNVIGKFAKYWDKNGRKVAVFNSSTGPSQLIFMRRFPNGLKELDEPNTMKESWEELYGKDSYDKDIAIMREFIVESDVDFGLSEPSLSSK